MGRRLISRIAAAVSTVAVLSVQVPATAFADFITTTTTTTTTEYGETVDVVEETYDTGGEDIDIVDVGGVEIPAGSDITIYEDRRIDELGNVESEVTGVEVDGVFHDLKDVAPSSFVSDDPAESLITDEGFVLTTQSLAPALKSPLVASPMLAASAPETVLEIPASIRLEQTGTDCEFADAWTVGGRVEDDESRARVSNPAGSGFIATIKSLGFNVPEELPFETDHAVYAAAIASAETAADYKALKPYLEATFCFDDGEDELTIGLDQILDGSYAFSALSAEHPDFFVLDEGDGFDVRVSGHVEIPTSYQMDADFDIGSMTIGYTAEEAVPNPYKYKGEDCTTAEGWEKCGDDLYWKIFDEGGSKLVIRGTGTMYDYASKASPWYNCSTLVAVDFGEAESIGNYAFQNSRLPALVIPDTVTSLGTYCFNASTIPSVNIPGTVEEIPGNAFRSATNLASVTLNEGTRSIGDYAFSQTSSSTGGIQTLTMPSTIERIGRYAFRYGRVRNVTLNEGLTSLGDEAFCSCGLYSISFPSTLASIPSGACKTNSALTSVTMAEGVKSIGGSAFQNAGITSIVIPESVTWLGANVFRSATKLTEVNIPSGVTSIPSYAFQNAPLADIVIPAGVTSIAANAFEGARDPHVVIPEGVTTINAQAFYNNKVMESISLPSTLKTMGNYVFQGCPLLTHVTLPEGMTTIGARFFSRSSLVSVGIPLTMRTVNNYAFDGVSTLATVYYAGSETDKSNMSISATGNGYFTGAEWIYDWTDGS